MPLSPFNIENFGGLNLFVSPEQVGAEHATAMSNVDLFPGGFRTRPGFTSFSDAATVAPRSLGYWHVLGGSGGNSWIIAQTNTNETTPFDIVTGTAGPTLPHAVVNGCYVTWDNFVTPRVYVGTMSGVYSFDGTSWTPSPSGGGPYIAVSPTDNRLVIASLLNGNVQFSDPSDPDTFDPLNFVDLDEDDGEFITGIVSWRDEVFVFKQTKFFVFGTPATDAKGNPEFLYRSVRTGIGGGAPCATPNGVYFTDGVGIYLTRGDAPQLISQAIKPWLDNPSVFGLLPSIDLGSASLCFFDHRLYVADPNSRTTLVYDPALDAWMIWRAGITGIVNAGGSLYLGNYTSKKLALLSGTTDDGAAVNWSYTSAQYPLSEPGRSAVTLESSISGSAFADVTFHLITSECGDLSTVVPAFLAGPTFAHLDQEGKLFQHKLTGSGYANISGITQFVSFVKPVGVE